MELNKNANTNVDDETIYASTNIGRTVTPLLTEIHFQRQFITYKMYS